MRCKDTKNEQYGKFFFLDREAMLIPCSSQVLFDYDKMPASQKHHYSGRLGRWQMLMDKGSVKDGNFY